MYCGAEKRESGFEAGMVSGSRYRISRKEERRREAVLYWSS